MSVGFFLLKYNLHTVTLILFGVWFYDFLKNAESCNYHAIKIQNGSITPKIPSTP